MVIEEKLDSYLDLLALEKLAVTDEEVQDAINADGEEKGDALYQRGLLNLKKRQYNQALEDFEAAVKIPLKRFKCEAHNMLATMLQLKDDNEGALYGTRLS